MIFRRTILVILLILLIGVGALTAWKLLQKSSTPLLSPEEIARVVGVHYGDPHPQNIQATSTETDNPPHDPMYLMAIDGYFHKGTITAHHLIFSALANRMYVWGIIAYNQPGKELWHDGDFAHPGI